MKGETNKIHMEPLVLICAHWVCDAEIVIMKKEKNGFKEKSTYIHIKSESRQTKALFTGSSK